MISPLRLTHIIMGFKGTDKLMHEHLMALVLSGYEYVYMRRWQISLISSLFDSGG
jgi:hypothetical protein